MVDRTKETVKNAYATTLGWVDQKTGELLVSIRGLSGAMEWTRELIADIKAGKEILGTAMEKIGEEIKESEAKVEVVIDEAIDAIEEVVKTKKKK